MRITDIEVNDTPDGARLTGVAVWDRAARTADRLDFLYRDVPAAALTGGAETLLASTLIPAMAVGEDIRLDVPVSARMLEGVAKIVRINKTWFPNLHRSRVEAEPAVPSATGTVTASFFSGGLDSFYTLLRPRAGNAVETLIAIVGFDLRFEKRAFAPAIVRRLEQAAASLGKDLVVVDSNAYEIGHKYVSKAEHQGGFLAAVALGLRNVRLCYIASSWTLWRDLPPFGSHPATDPLWSTEATEFVHDGVELSRPDKCFEIADNDVMLEHLRVCVYRPDLYNCGMCSKCVSTAFNLQLAGTIDRCATLERVTPQQIRRAKRMGGPYDEVFAELLERTTDPDFRRAVRLALRRGRYIRIAKPVVAVGRRFLLRMKVRRFQGLAPLPELDR